MALFMCLTSSFINSTFGCYFCLGVVQSSPTTQAWESGLGVRSQFRTTLFPAKNSNKRNCALTPNPRMGAGSLVNTDPARA